jgi:hypothetical protein
LSTAGAEVVSLQGSAELRRSNSPMRSPGWCPGLELASPLGAPIGSSRSSSCGCRGLGQLGEDCTGARPIMNRVSARIGGRWGLARPGEDWKLEPGGRASASATRLACAQGSARGVTTRQVRRTLRTTVQLAWPWRGGSSGTGGCDLRAGRFLRVGGDTQDAVRWFVD